MPALQPGPSAPRTLFSGCKPRTPAVSLRPRRVDFRGERKDQHLDQRMSDLQMSPPMEDKPKYRKFNCENNRLCSVV